MPKPCLRPRCPRGHVVLGTIAWTLEAKGAGKMTRPTQMQGVREWRVVVRVWLVDRGRSEVEKS